MILRDIIRSLPSGTPISAGTEVRIYRERDNFLLDTVTTDANGMFEFQSDGNPGVVRYVANVGAGSKVHSTRSILPVNDLDLSGVRPLLSTFLDGVVVNYKDALEVVADGLSMKVTVGAGVAVARGVIYRQEATRDITIPAASANPRIDVIAVRFWLDEGGDNAGRCELIHKQGIEGVTPVAPTLEQTSAIWETPLAQVRVDPSVIGIAQGKVADTRLVSIPFIPDGAITKAQLSSDVQFGPHISEGGVVVTNSAHFIDFSADQFDIIDASSGGTQYAVVNLRLGASGTSLRPARENHAHSRAVKSFGRITPASGLGSVSDRDTKTITLPAVPTVCIFRVKLRVEGAGGTTANGSLYLKILGVKQESFSFQADQGVDSTIESIAGITTAGATSITVSWGMDMSSGLLNVKDGWIEWDCQPES